MKREAEGGERKILSLYIGVESSSEDTKRAKDTANGHGHKSLLA